MKYYRNYYKGKLEGVPRQWSPRDLYVGKMEHHEIRQEEVPNIKEAWPAGNRKNYFRRFLLKMACWFTEQFIEELVENQNIIELPYRLGYMAVCKTEGGYHPVLLLNTMGSTSASWEYWKLLKKHTNKNVLVCSWAGPKVKERIDYLVENEGHRYWHISDLQSKTSSLRNKCAIPKKKKRERLAKYRKNNAQH